MQLNWVYKSFGELTTTELYAILQLRLEVFAVEQNCPYQDADGKDQAAFHLCGWDKEQLAAYCRLLPAGVSYEHPSIGRVVTSPRYRKGGHGRQLMKNSIAISVQQFKNPVIIISAQLYLQHFYESFGFVACGESYLEDDIPHIRMKLDK